MKNDICRLSGGDVPHGEGRNGDHADPARQLHRQAGHAARRGRHPRSERPYGREQPPWPPGAAEGLQRHHHTEGAAQLQGRAGTSTGKGVSRTPVRWFRSTGGGMRWYFSRPTCVISECQAFENWDQMRSINNIPHTIWDMHPSVDCSIPHSPPYSNMLAPQLTRGCMYVRHWPLDQRGSDVHILLPGRLSVTRFSWSWSWL